MFYPRINRKINLIFMLSALTTLCIFAQLSFFIIHYHVFDLFDSLVTSSLSHDFNQPTVLFPILFFIAIQIVTYTLFVAWIAFQALSIGKLLQLSEEKIYGLGIFLWLISVATILILNCQLYPHSFFSQWFFLKKISYFPLYFFLPILLISFILSFINLFLYRQYKWLGGLFLVMGLSFFIIAGVNRHVILTPKDYSTSTKPNIIFISIDSGRPDFINSKDTPTLYQIQKTSATFTNAYTPLARSFPAWISVLTGLYPKYHHARANLTHPKDLKITHALPHILQQLGYETIYGADETRFANITKQYGFDEIIGIKGSAVEFLLASLNDAPLTNLLVNLPIGRYLFPYSYANRAAAITYQPNQFLNLVKQNLADRHQQKPLFLALHLCLAHWPFTWADSPLFDKIDMPNQYRSALKKQDAELKKLMAILDEAGLLNNTLLVLFSDHGTGLGLRHDRSIEEKKYQGDPKFLGWITRYPLHNSEKLSVNFNKNFPLNTSYGQGTDVLSLSQYRVLLSFKTYGSSVPARPISVISSLLDITPTVLDFLNQLPNPSINGLSLKSEILNLNKKSQNHPRPFFLETGDKMAEIETDHINVNQVVKKGVAAYQIDKQGRIYLTQEAIRSIIDHKQRAVLYGDLLLARLPEQQIMVPELKNQSLSIVPKTIPPYFVLVNLRTGKWEISKSALFRDKEAQVVTEKFYGFYGDEV